MFLLEWPGGDWQTTLLWTGLVFAAYVGAIWLALVFWTARDIRQRSSNPAAQVGAVLLVGCGFLPGHWLYLVMRPRTTKSQRYGRTLEEAALEHVLAEAEGCSRCAYPVRAEYLVCPSCRLELKELCRECARPIDRSWAACPYCMRALQEEEPATVAVLSLNGAVLATVDHQQHPAA
jgi:hypothetical protein